MIDYIVVSTSRCNYQKWQLELLNWSRKKVSQQGKLIILLSDDVNHHNEETIIEFDDSDVIVFNLPDYAKEWEIENDDWWGGIPNKYESIKWFAENGKLNDSDTLLFLDPDMIFTEQINISPGEDEVIGQKWIDYSSWLSEEYDTTETIMYPFAIKFETLKKIVDDYKNECIKFRKETNQWISEMHGLDYCLKKNNIKITTLENLGRCTVWNPSGSDIISKIIHFPNKITTNDDKSLFFKQDFTFNPSMDIDSQKARNYTDRFLLNSINQSRTDFLYWLKYNDDISSFDYDGSGGYLVFDPWPGGFNNIRMSIELAVCIAFLTNRTLVLYQPYQIYLLNHNNDSTFFFDKNFGIKTISFSDFCKAKNIKEDYGEVEKISKVIDEDVVPTILNFENINPPSSFHKHRKVVNTNDIFSSNDEIIFFRRNLLGNFYQTLYTHRKDYLKKLIRSFVRYNTNIFDLAWKFISKLGDKTYYSIHIRRNDFQYKDLFIDSEDILDNIKEIVPEGSKLYISTDHNDEEFFKKFYEKYEVVFYNDLVKKLPNDEVHEDIVPIIEQLICTRSKSFIGNKLSTLSSYIFRLRGYMNDIEDKKYYINTEKPSDGEQIFFKEDDKYIATWAREYKDVFTFDNRKIFLSIASYCDSQLSETIQSALDNISDKDKVRIVVHDQNTQEEHQKLLEKEFINTEFIFTEKDESKGVIWARNRIREKFDNEDFFLQVDSHTRFKKDWDLILLNSYDSIEDEKVIITTYPNHFDYPDTDKKYLELDHNTPLKINRFLQKDSNIDNRRVAGNLPSLEDYETVKTKWAAAGFFFATGSWLGEVEIPDNIKFNGEEDHLTFLSFLKGWNLYITPEAVVWHNYDYKNVETDKPYREHNNKTVEDEQGMEHVNNFLFNKTHQRTLEELEEYFEIKLRRNEE